MVCPTLVDGEYQVVKGGLAYEHLPANPAVEGITFPERDVQGTIIDYSRRPEDTFGGSDTSKNTYASQEQSWSIRQLEQDGTAMDEYRI